MPVHDKPVFGLILLGGPLSGALVRDVRLANELADRGYTVHVWWVMDRNRTLTLRPSITQHWLAHAFRFRHRTLPTFWEWLGRLTTRIVSDRRRFAYTQKRPAFIDAVMGAMVLHVVRGVETDEPLIKRFSGQLRRTGVTHLLPMLSILSHWILAARKSLSSPPKYVVTFQGYELYVHYAKAAGAEAQFYERLRQAVTQSDYRAIAVSADYARRVEQDVGVPAAQLVAIPPGVPPGSPMPRARAIDLLRQRDKNFRDDLPLIAYLGRQNAEKGIDLLLYAAKMLQEQGVQFQLLVCGPTLFGKLYRRVCIEIASNLRLSNLRMLKAVSDEMRSAVFSLAHCVVYPSIHREPFGMVPAEAIAHRCPAIVPDVGGVATAIEAHGVSAGLTFRAWDSGDLAQVLRRLLTEQGLREKLIANAPTVAEYYSVKNLGDRVLQHLDLLHRAEDSPAL